MKWLKKGAQNNRVTSSISKCLSAQGRKAKTAAPVCAFVIVSSRFPCLHGPPLLTRASGCMRPPRCLAHHSRYPTPKATAQARLYLDVTLRRNRHRLHEQATVIHNGGADGAHPTAHECVCVGAAQPLYGRRHLPAARKYS
ncbi:hypothetical protein HPB52_008363 [Rhipicephalus sanguineus]|uniref:Uncharacterized protein n=1 Tax=Rhipicephalus sanguineus TaxID=34632 RepID=A0A9D4T8Z1_RHISA|nr:hypothetical protein HPB52_008363 [Rhipicephalus sanguineus]